MKKIKLMKRTEFAVFQDNFLYCDFCGERETSGFTSSFDDRKDGDNRKCEMQICTDCVKQLSKLTN